MNEISAFIKEIPARRPIYKIGSGLSSDTGSYQNIDSGLFSLRTVRNAFVVCKSLNLWYFCYRSSNGLMQRLFCSSCLFLIALPMHFCFHGTNSIPNRRTKKKSLFVHWRFTLIKSRDYSALFLTVQQFSQTVVTFTLYLWCPSPAFIWLQPVSSIIPAKLISIKLLWYSLLSTRILVP